MAIAVVMEFSGGNLGQYDQTLEKMQLTPGGQTPPGALFHWVAATEDGIRVTDVWESREHFDTFAQEKIGPITGETGLPEPETTFFEVHNYLTA